MGLQLGGLLNSMQSLSTCRPLILGLLGGIASGKSLVAEVFRRHGALVLDADKGVAALFEEPAIKQSLADLFGATVFDTAGGVNRQRLAAIVFAPDGRALRKSLEDLLHPRVERALVEALTAALAASPVPDVVLFDVPLLAENPRLLLLCERLIFVAAPEEDRERRCREVRNWKAGERARREQLQLPLPEKRALARHVIVNSGSVADIEEAARELHSGVLAAHRLAEELARHGPKAHGGLGPEARARDGARRDRSGSGTDGGGAPQR